MSKIYQLLLVLFWISNSAYGQTKQECLDMLHDNLLLLENFLHADKYQPSDLHDLQADFKDQIRNQESATRIDEEYLFPRGYPPVIKYIYPNTWVEVAFDRFTIANILGDGYSFTLDFMDNIADAIYKVKKIYFLDGAIEEGEDLIIDRIISKNTSSQSLMLKGSKPIKSFDYSMETNFNSEITYQINEPGQTIQTSTGTIEIIHCGDGYVRVKVPEHMRHVIKILTEDDAGNKLLKVMSGNGAAYKSEYLKPHIEALERGILALENNEITCAEASAKFSYERIIADLRDKENSLFLTEYFVSDFRKAYIVVYDSKQVDRKVYLRNSADQSDGGPADFHERCSCAVAQDANTELFGIIGLDGSWIIAPTFARLNEQWGNKSLFLGRLPGEEVSFQYTYDKENKTLTKM